MYRRYGTNASVGDYYDIANKTPQYDSFTYNPGLQPLYDSLAGYPAATRVLRRAHQDNEDLVQQTAAAIAANQNPSPSIPQELVESFNTLREKQLFSSANMNIFIIGLVIILIVLCFYHMTKMFKLQQDNSMLNYRIDSLRDTISLMKARTTGNGKESDYIAKQEVDEYAAESQQSAPQMSSKVTTWGLSY